MSIADEILNAASRAEVERLSQQLEIAPRGCIGPSSRFLSATYAYADSPISVPDGSSIDQSTPITSASFATA
jgi:hypothetical protein